jgi:molybdenum-dependent DNA-binding transcriptional regulator ModE
LLDNVIINQLRAFVAVCDQGTFSRAARKLRRAQSAISHAIKALDSAFDVELLERNTRKAQLTAAGRSLLPDARAVISRTEEMKNRAGAIAKAGLPQVNPDAIERRWLRDAKMVTLCAPSHPLASTPAPIPKSAAPGTSVRSRS